MPRAACVFAELGQGTINSGWHDVHLEVETNNSILACMWTGGETCVTIGTGITYGQWYHVVMRYTASPVELTGFVNGVKGATNGTAKSYPQLNGNGLYYGLGATDSTNGGTGLFFRTD